MTGGRALSLVAGVAVLALTAWFAWRGDRFIDANGPTFDEGVHLASGYAYWKAGEFRLNGEDPPLFKLLWALPLLFRDAPPFPPDVAPEYRSNLWHVGDAWMYGTNIRPRALLNTARRVNLTFGCTLVLLIGWVGYRVWGSKLAGVAACAFAAADPTLLALSCVLSTDLGVTLFGLLTCYLMWEYASHPSRGLVVALGVGAGLLLATKLSGIGLVAGLGLAALFFVGCGGRLGIPGRNERGLGPAVELAIRIGTIAIVVVAATYAFIHFPEWARGLKFQLTRQSHADGVAYLNGEISRDGWYHYFLVALPLKLSLGLLIAAGAGALSLVGSVRQASGARWLFLVLPPIVFFALASYSRVNVGVRAVYPFVPFLYLLAGGLAAGACCALARSAILAVCLGICVGSAQRASPYELSFFNELVRGPENGAKYLADSNLDWGQGLPALKRWMDAHGVEMVYLGYFGTDRPESHGIRYQSLPGYGGLDPRGETIFANAQRHVLAVSVNNLLGLQLNDPETYSWLRDREPAAVVAGCIHVYDLTGDPAAIARVRALPSR